MANPTPRAAASSRRNALRLMGSAALAAGALMTAARPSEAGGAASPEPIIGAWISSANTAFTSPRIVTYSSDGIFDVVAVDPTRSGARGVWVRTGDRQYLTRSLSFRIDPPTGKVLGIIDSRRQLTVNAAGDSVSGNQVVREFGPDGALINTTNGVVDDVRIMSLPQ